MQHSRGEVNELQLITKAVAFLALLTVLLYLRALISGGVATAGLSGSGSSSLLAAMILGTIALAVGWWWELAGGAGAVLSALTVAALVYLIAESNQTLAAFVYASPFLIAGALYLFDWWKSEG